ncbi:MAG: class II fructose-bisphosphate aldolase [Acidimicrobiia bacterium]|nr:class II fructose-bisphosphate aldolase [Acidimicrobiia bacterium]NNF89092.1 class II fructose-bisphosphate aldolase [Acidimicrobiia bacterium]NNJ48510.1 class II fructose-bisphosphate aldolase [Acidimicrobiia bacterium]NNL14496.1 class II fructose-bisphosphate aldolase [Acidimicrobiia bacterium]RZV43887.1 MAG: class II fructose-bisphosphate aldolase [Acidimicrobiia bacterium]
MPIATPDKYKAMLAAAQEGKYAFPAINVTSSETMNAAMRGLAESESDGIIQISTGGGSFGSGTYVQDMAAGAAALAEFASSLADRYPVNFALHTDHCQADKVDTFIRPLLEIAKQRRGEGKPPLFQSHMFDGSAIPLDENLKISAQLYEEMTPLDVLLEVEAGVVGGEEDGVEAAENANLYTTPEDVMKVVEALGVPGEHTYLLAATFGNVHGSYKPGNVKLRPEILKECQDTLKSNHPDARFLYVFHGGSGSLMSEIHEAVDYGVIKMNVDTDNQYAFTRPIAGHMMANYDGVLKIDGEVGNKKVYDPRSYLKAAETAMAARVVQTCEELRSVGKTIGR